VKIGFVLSFPQLTGGHLAVLEIGTRLVRRGHEVAMIWPRRSILSRRNTVLRKVPGFPRAAYALNRGGIDWFDFPGRTLEVEELRGDQLPELDAVVATAWQTAEWVSELGPRQGRHVYYIQHHETWTGSSARVEATWRRPFVRIVSSEWLRPLVGDDVAVVPYGVDLDLFHPAARSSNAPPRVGLLYHREAWKGVADALAAIAPLDVQLVSFGVFERGDDLPAGTEYHRQPTRGDLAELYRSLDVFVAPSWTETGPMTVPEAMASGICVVATDVGNVSLWSNGGEGAVVVPPRRPDMLRQAIAEVLGDGVRRAEVAARGHELIQSFTWERAAEQFEAIVEAAV
jgi:glycosyltransferase involved in cell wall biosynthesis